MEPHILSNIFNGKFPSGIVASLSTPSLLTSSIPSKYSRIVLTFFLHLTKLYIALEIEVFLLEDTALLKVPLRFYSRSKVTKVAIVREAAEALTTKYRTYLSPNQI